MDGILAKKFAQRVWILRVDRGRFRGRKFFGEPITRGRSGIHELRNLRVPRGLQDTDSALDIDIHILGGPLDRWNDVADSCEMEDILRAGKNVRIRSETADVFLEKQDGRFDTNVVGYILGMPTGEVVDDPDLVASLDQEINGVASDEPSASCYDGYRQSAQEA